MAVTKKKINQFKPKTSIAGADLLPFWDSSSSETSYIDRDDFIASIDDYVLKAGDTMTGYLDFANNRGIQRNDAGISFQDSDGTNILIDTDGVIQTHAGHSMSWAADESISFATPDIQLLSTTALLYAQTSLSLNVDDGIFQMTTDNGDFESSWMYADSTVAQMGYGVSNTISVADKTGSGILLQNDLGAININSASGLRLIDSRVGAAQVGWEYNVDCSPHYTNRSIPDWHAVKNYTDTAINNLLNGAGAAYDTLKELQDLIVNDETVATALAATVATKVPQTRTLTINGTTYDLSSNRSWTVSSSQWITTGSDIYYNTGKVGIGLIAPAVQLHVLETSTSVYRGVSFDQYNTGTQSSKIYFRKSRGTVASPSVIVTGDVLSNLTSAAWDGSAFVDSASIRVTSLGTIATGIVASKMELQTMTAAGALTTGLTIDEAQLVTFANAIAFTNISAPSTPGSGFKFFSDASGRMSWKGSNGYVRTFDGTSNTADRIYTLPDYAGTVGIVNASGSIPGLVDEDQVYIQGATNKTYPLISKKIYAGTINGLYGLKTASGTCTVAIQINGTNVTGLSSISVTSSTQDVTASALNTLSAGDRVTIVVTSASAPVDLECILKITR